MNHTCYLFVCKYSGRIDGSTRSINNNNNEIDHVIRSSVVVDIIKSEFLIRFDRCDSDQTIDLILIFTDFN